MPGTFNITVGKNGTSPNPAKIGKQGRKLVWTCQGSGSVTSVTITDGGGAFSDGHTVGNNYQMTYNGSTGNQTWDYSYASSCKGNVNVDPEEVDDSPRLTNGSG